MTFHMNPARGRHMEGKPPAGHEEAHEEHGGSAAHMPSIHIHSHEKGHTVHIMHPSGEHEKHEHEAGDAEGIASHIHEHIGGEPGQDHGVNDGSAMEDEDGLGGPGV